MRNQETSTHSQTDAFVQAARELHDEGKEWLYRDEIGLHMSRNLSETKTGTMTRYKTVRKVLGRIGTKIGLERAAFPQSKLEPITEMLEEEGRLEAEWEAPQLQRDGHPQMRIYRLPEEARTA